jgi:hypothetical protein
MTRKDFELIAETIRFLEFDNVGRISKESIAEQFAKALQRNNSGFKPERFIEAATKPLKGAANDSDKR